MEGHSYREMSPGPAVYADPSMMMEVFSGGGHVPVLVIASNPVSVRMMFSVESSLFGGGGGGGATVVVVSSVDVVVVVCSVVVVVVAGVVV